MLHADGRNRDPSHLGDQSSFHDKDGWRRSSRSIPSTAGSVVSDTINSTDADAYSYREEWDLVGDSQHPQTELVMQTDEDDNHANSGSIGIERRKELITNKTARDVDDISTSTLTTTRNQGEVEYDSREARLLLCNTTRPLSADCISSEGAIDDPAKPTDTPPSASSSSEGTCAPVDGETRRIQVLVRVRPACGSAEDKTVVSVCNQSVIQVQSSNSHGGMTGMSTVTECGFDRVFSTSATQEDIFSAIEPSVRAAIEGYNSTVFAYGQTGTGKTHTLFGKNYDSVLPIDSGLGCVALEKPADSVSFSEASGAVLETSWGIVPRALCLLLTHAAQVSTEGVRLSLQCSFVQIYNDRLFDLLTDRRRQKPLLLREQPRGDGLTSVVIQGLSSERIETATQALQLLRQGLENRSVRETDANLASSRSHAIVQVNITLERTLSTGGQSVRASRLNLVDLAGSEKWNTDLPMDEAHSLELKNINASLSALGNCIAALGEPSRKHIPYRDSTLTRVLQDSLGGNTQSCLIATVSPSLSSCEETIRTLQFADRARSVMQIVRVNDTSGGLSTELLAARAQITKLRDRLESAYRRHHEARLKELDECQRRFTETLKGKDREIYKLSRNNAAFLKWKEEDSRRIKELESRVLELESSCGAVQQLQSHNTASPTIVDGVNTNRGVDEATDHDDQKGATQSIKASTVVSNQLEEIGSTACAKPDRSHRDVSTRGIARSSSKTNLPRLAADKNSEPRLGNHGSRTYKQLLERYTLAQGRAKYGNATSRVDVAVPDGQDASHIPTSSAMATMIPRIASISPRIGTPPSPAQSGSPMLKSPALFASRHSTSSLTPTPAAIDSMQNPFDPSNTNGRTLLKATSTYSVGVDLPGLEMSAFHSPIPVKSTSTVPFTLATVTPAQLSTKAPGVEAWAIREVQWEQNSAVAAALAPMTKPNSTQCVKHSLRGCVLCSGALDAAPARSLPTVPIANQSDSSYTNDKAAEFAAQDGPCARHRLSRCFICCKTSAIDASVVSPSQFQVNAARVDKPAVFGQSNAPPGAVLLSKCAAHSLSNCILCSKGLSGAAQVERRASMLGVVPEAGVRNYLVDLRAMRLSSSSLTTSFPAVGSGAGLDGSSYGNWGQANV